MAMLQKRKKNKRNKRKRIALSKSKLANWLFRSIIKTLESSDVKNIYKVKILKWPKDRRKRLLGYLDDDGGIWLSGENESISALAKTLIHEASHVYLYTAVERRIRRFEDLLWADLSKNQKNIIKSYIPKHFVDKQPKDEPEKEKNISMLNRKMTNWLKRHLESAEYRSNEFTAKSLDRIREAILKIESRHGTSLKKVNIEFKDNKKAAQK
ncbi:hypothetical protein GW950_00520 [Candidatus Wolfebacteria bacterium]|nr:hypothetical protein [Candidatus Wolfebacteria bacterium]